MRHLLLIPLVLLVLASCAPRTETVYEPPPLAFGGSGSCVEQCEIQAIQCRQGAAASVGACRAADAPIASGFNGCRAGSPGCVALPICLADTQTCTEQYNSCFNTCGGLVRVIRTPYYKFDAMPTTPFVVPPLPSAAPPAPVRPARRRAVPFVEPS